MLETSKIAAGWNTYSLCHNMNPSRSKNPIPSSDPYSNLRELASMRIVSGRVKIAAKELMLVHCRTRVPLASNNSVPLIVTVNNDYSLPPPPRFFISVHGSVDIPGTVLISRVDKKRLTVFSDGAGGTRAEVGLLPFARVALQLATQVLPPYRTRFSNPQFTQPQLLAVLCLIRSQAWTFREGLR